VLLEFPSMDALEAFYLSPEYQALKAIRLKSSVARAAIAVEGIDT